MNNSKEQRHLVLGGAGAIGQATIAELKNRGLQVQAIERSKRADGVETINADLLDRKRTVDSIHGATHVYVCVGLSYKSKIWQEQWPQLINNVIDACSQANAKLIFFDNVYMYGPPPLSIPFDETHPQTPQTKKGKVRKIVADLVLDAHKTRKVQAVIGRSADFYGPNAKISSLYIGFLERILQGKNPQGLGKANQEHTYAYTLDNGKALVELALDDSTYGQVWHLPVGKMITNEKVLEIINNELHTNHKISYMPKTLLGPISLFVPMINEVKEMLYQFDNTYEMSYEKFHKKFPNFIPTDYEKGIQEMIMSFRVNNAL